VTRLEREALADGFGSEAFALFERTLREYTPHADPILGAAKIQRKDAPDCDTGCAYPVNFQQPDLPQNQANGVLFVPNYTWGSSTGNLNDLGNGSCAVQEQVLYPGAPSQGQAWFNWPAPFPSGQTINPYYNSVDDPTTGAMTDTLSPASGPYRQPLFTTQFSATQNFRFSCDCLSGRCLADAC
jgi:hypothetical protein